VSTTTLSTVGEGLLAGLAVDAKAGIAFATWEDGTATRHALKDNTALPGPWPAAGVEPLEEPGDVAVGPAGEVYVLEGGVRVRAFDGRTGKERGQWGPLVDATGLAVLPAGADGSTWVYTIDEGVIRVRVFIYICQCNGIICMFNVSMRWLTNHDL
jgi:hypothetical protein